MGVMGSKRDENHAGMDLRVGIALGAGLSFERAADLLDVAKNSINNHKQCPHTLEVKALAAAALTAQVERRVEDSREAWLSEIRKRRGKHLDLADRLVLKAEAADADADLILKAMKATGDLHDRDPETSKTSKVEHTADITERHIFEIDAPAMAALQAAVLQIKQIRELPGEVADVIDVEPDE